MQYLFFGLYFFTFLLSESAINERESFARLVTTEMAAQEIADEMGISRRVLSLKIKTLQFIVDVKKLKRRYLYV